MCIRTLMLASVMVAAAQSAPAAAGPCDAYFPFDGTLADASGNGHDGEMLAGDVAVNPTFVQGKLGQALSLDGTGAMRAPIDLHYDLCPQVTMTAWIYVSRDVPNDTMQVLSTGGGSGLGLWVSNTFLTLAGTENGIGQQQAIQKGTWTFVAGVYDWTAGQYTLYWNARSKSQKLSPYRYEPKPALWVGTVHDEWDVFAKGILIDDLRIVGRTLTQAEVAAVRTSAPVSTATASANASTAQPVAAASAACAAQGDCAAGSYCAVDGTCHPDADRPMTATPGAGSQVAGIGQSGTRPAPNVDYQAPPDLMQGSGQSTSGSGNGMSQIQQRNSRVAPDIDYEPPPDLNQGGSAGGGTTETANATAAAPFGGSIGPADGKTVHELLADHDFGSGPTGDVGECTTFSEVVADIATSVRDAIVQAAVSANCTLMQQQVVNSVTWQTLSSSDIDGPKFQEALLAEVYNNCVAATSAATRIPDAMVQLWNQKIAQGGWATIGPRQLVIGQTHYGDLRSPGDRKFITSDPLSYGDPLKMRLVEEGGKARVTARICTVSLHNDYRLVHTLEINDTAADRQNEKQEFSRDLDGALFRFLIVYLNAHGTPNRHFKYELTPLQVITTN